MLITALALGAAAGLSSSLHCAFMCGPLATLACAPYGSAQYSSTRERTLMGSLRSIARPLGLYQAGRSLTYGILGALVGGFGTALQRSLAARFTTFAVSWSLALAMGVLAWQLVKTLRRGAANAESAKHELVTLRPKTLPTPPKGALASLVRQPFFLGLATGFLPCGALIAGLLVAASTASVPGGALCMVAFVWTSGLVLAAVSPASAWISRGFGIDARRFLVLVLTATALVLAVRPFFVTTACSHCENQHARSTTPAETLADAGM